MATYSDNHLRGQEVVTLSSPTRNQTLCHVTDFTRHTTKFSSQSSLTASINAPATGQDEPRHN